MTAMIPQTKLPLRQSAAPNLARTQHPPGRPAAFPLLPCFQALAMALLSILILAGCATSSVQTRRQENAAAYSHLSPEARSAVDQGKITVGMPTDAVYIAWGKPAKTEEGESAQGPLTTWIYYGSYQREHRYWKESPFYRDRRVLSGPTLETEYVPASFVRARVLFQNGLVTEWHQYQPPPPE